MAYCKECGAYIPDAQTKCLACGYDEAEEKTAQAYEYKYEQSNVNTDFLKEQLEKQRQRQRENSRKWAEAEKAQREKTSQSYNYSPSRSTDNKKYSAPTSFSGSQLFSLMSYFGILFVLPYIFCKNDDFALFHAKQGMILFFANLVVGTAASILGLRWIVNIARIYFIYKGVVSSLNGRKDQLPYIGSLF